MEVLDELNYDACDACQPAWDRFRSFLNQAPGEQRVIQATVGEVALSLQLAPLLDCDLGAEREWDAVFFDPFAPDDSPELWTESVLETVVRRLRGGGRLVTYCVRSSVQRQLRGLGLKVEKAPGPQGGKREVLIATRLDGR